MERYKEYKDSGIQWIGEIPSHWKIFVLKRIIRERKAGCWGNEPSSFLNNNICLRIADFEYSKLKFNTSKEYTIRGYKDSEVENRYLKNGDILIEKSGGGDKMPVGRAVLYNLGMQNVMYANFMEKISVKEIVLSSFLVYLLSCMYSKSAIWPYIKFTTGIQNLDLSSFLANEKIPLPPFYEQEIIANYIESKTSKIDEYIKEKEKEVQLLNELKEAIAKVVTQGLNPNVKMKDSGISWIGMIPEHWEVSRMKRIFSEAKEKTTTEGGTLLSLSQYTGITLKDDAKKVGMFEAESTIGYNVVHPGQFVMNIMLAWNGSYAVSDYEGIISPSYCVFNFNEQCEKKYFHYLLRLPAYAGAFKTMSKGIIESRLRLYPLYFLAFKTIIPPIEEQQAIVSYINDKTAKVVSLISELEAEIDYLKEYKQRLIADCVTGQVNVQNIE